MSDAVADHNYVIDEQRLVGTYIGEMSDALGITLHPSLGDSGSSLLTGFSRFIGTPSIRLCSWFEQIVFQRFACHGSSPVKF